MSFRSLLLISILALPALAQPISFGITGGVGLTDAFSNRTVNGIDNIAHFYSNSKDYVVGPIVELKLALGFSVEFDALYRRLNLTLVNTILPSYVVTQNQSVNSWEFPLLAKYRLSARIVKPFIEAGPSFRHVSQFSGDSPHLSEAGFTAGIGASFGIPHFKLQPEVRYTRWGSDSNPATVPSMNPQSNPNQAEFLLGLFF